MSFEICHCRDFLPHPTYSDGVHQPRKKLVQQLQDVKPVVTNEFFTIKLGNCQKTCRVCNQKKADRRKKTAGASGESYHADDDDNKNEESDLGHFTLEEYLTIIAMDETARSFSALVNVEVLHLKGRDLVDAIALEVWQCVGYR
ncbi:hypothetical protein B0H13DRAFT_1927983 [Mycena leptocephala]|nr:hypothetical protein B0H13DRAFT_1927983 [Mycena leptocephala]